MLNLFQKLVEVRKAAGYVQKSKAAYNYKFTPEDEILAKVTVAMNKHNLVMLPQIVPGSISIEPIRLTKTKIKTDKTGTPITLEENYTEYLCKADMIFKWIDADNPSDTLEIPWAMVAQQSDASFSFGGALTYSNRMLLLKALNIATAEYDQDSYRAKQAEAAAWENKEVTDAIISEIESIISEKVNDTNKAAVKKAILEAKVVTENGRASNKYNLIKDAESATAYLNVLKKAVEVQPEPKNTTKETK